MTKVNPTKKSSKTFSEEKLAGGGGMKAAAQDAEALLRRSVLACLLWENNFYEDGESGAENIKRLIPLVHPLRVAEIAIEARIKQKLRHIPLFIAVEMLKHEPHKYFVSELLPAIITRADQITDILALYWAEGKKPLANQLKKGLAKAFLNFDEYQLAKYNRNAEIKLVDVANLVRPKPTQEKYELFRRLMKNELKTPDTWEVSLSAGKDKKQTWERLINEGKLGGLAFLRNLRNMKDASVDHNIIRKGLSNMKSSMLLPLNFLSAVQYADEFTKEIETAMMNCYSNLPKLSGYTVFVIDVSGSMSMPVSAKTKFRRLEAAAAMAILAANQCEKIDIYCTAGGSDRHCTKKINYPQNGFALLEQVKELEEKLGGGGIFTRQCLDYIKSQTNETPDRIIVFSDSQDCDHVNKKPTPFGKKNYIVDVAAHSRGVNYKGAWNAEISGWSEHFLTYIASYEGIENKFQEEIK